MTAHLMSSYGLERKSKAELQAAYTSLTHKAPDHLLKKDELVEELRKILEAVRDQRHRLVEVVEFPKSKTLCEIPASEVNDWLQGLPRKEYEA